MNSGSKSTRKAPAGDSSAPQRDPLDEALEETFPASDPIQPSVQERLPPANAPGSDVRE